MDGFKAIVGIIGGTIAILIGAYLISPVATAITTVGAVNGSALCTYWDAAGKTCLTSSYSSAQSLLMNVPLFVVLGIIVAAITLMILAALKE